MRFSYAMDTFPCHLFQKSAEPRNSEENSCIVIIFEMPKHFKVNSENARRFIHSDLWHFLKNVGENVLIIGDGPSGQDLIIHLSSVAKSITLSRKNWLNATKEAQEKYHKKFPPTLFVKDIVKRLTADGVEFIDGTRDIFSAVIFATGRMHLNIFIMAKFKSFLYGIFTGYKFSYSFLSVESGIHVDDSFIQPLYKHVINIEHPTMALIGIPRSALNFAMFDLQVIWTIWSAFVLNIKIEMSEKHIEMWIDRPRDLQHSCVFFSNK